MRLRRLIADFFGEYQAGLHDANGRPLSRELVRREYGALRGFLLDSCGSDDLVAIRLAYDYRYLLAICACMELGVTYVPLREDWPEARVAQVKALTGFGPVLDESGIARACAFAGKPRRPPSALSPSQALYVICTSGTTGAPKGIVIERRSFQSFLDCLDARFGQVDRDSRLLLTSDFVFDMSLIDLGLFLLRRCSLFFSRFDGNPFRLAREIELHRITALTTVPHNVAGLLDDVVAGKTDLSSLRFVQVTGAPLSSGLCRTICRKLLPSAEVFHLYGTTEVTVYSHLRRLSGREEEELSGPYVSAGRPFAPVLCLLRDSSGARVDAAGAVGEVLLGGAHVMRGYIGDPQKTSESTELIDGTRFYRTGDLAFRDEKGSYYIVGRKDDTLKHRGFRVNLTDIDSYIARLDCVREAATLCYPNREADNVLVTCVVAKRSVTEKELRRQMAEVLVDFQLPDHIEFVDSLPTNDSGKISRQALAERFRGKYAA